MLKAMTDESYAFLTIFLVANFWKKRIFFVAEMSHTEILSKAINGSFQNSFRLLQNIIQLSIPK